MSNDNDGVVRESGEMLDFDDRDDESGDDGAIIRSNGS